jgi:hypothetical protein
VTAPALYGRPVNLYWDAQHLPRIAAIMAEVASPVTVVGVALGILALLAVAFGGLRWSVSRLWRAMHHAGSRRAIIALSGALVALYGLEQSRFPWRTTGWFSLPVSPLYAEQGQFVLNALTASRSARPLSEEKTLAPSALERLRGADVLLMFIESYGAAAYDLPTVAEQQAPARHALAAALDATGRRAVSAFVESPTFGGGSWLAHVSLLSGVPVRTEAAYNLLLAQRRETLAHRFTAHGYRAVAVMPGLKREWPEGAFHGFAQIYGERALGYTGPSFGWWRIPDQYALAKLDHLELGTGPRAPVFAFFPTINTHAPFRPTPPFQPHWDRVLTEQPYDADEIARSLAPEPEWTQLGDAYAETLAYVFRCVAAYLDGRASEDLVLVLLGDHQPPASVTGEGARWDVPVHVISTSDDIMVELIDAGFVAGLTPQGEAIGTMSDLTTLLLQAFGSDPAMSSGDVESGVDIAGAGAVIEPGDERSNSIRIEPALR